MGALQLSAEHRWECPNCWESHVTRSARPHTPFHRCRGLAGLRAPFVAAGTVCKVQAVERGDYVGREQVQSDAEGRPWMAVVTTRDNGQDCAVLAPLAVADRSET
jgi:hypothetical protein